MWNLKKYEQMNLYKEKEQTTDIENKLMVTKQERKGKEGINWEFGVNRYTLLYKIDKQQEPTVQHRELYSIPCNNL